MTTLFLTTYSDAIEYVTDFLGSDTGADAQRKAKRAILGAYNELMTAAEWTYFLARGRFNTVAPYITGTIQYQQSGGSSPRLVTLTGGTWPSWANVGTIAIQNISYEIAAVLSSTTLQLTNMSNPGADIAAGAGFILYQDRYALPADYLSGDELVNVNFILSLQYVHPSVWLKRQRILRTPAAPYNYSILGDPHHQGAMCAAFYPAPDQVYAMEFLYKRKARALVVDNYSTGTLSASAGATTVTGTGTAWTSKLAGAVIRFGADTKNVPTSVAGLYPALEERVVTSVASATSLTVDQPLSSSYGGNKYLVSDPLDFDIVPMLNAYWRCCDKHAAIITRMKDLQRIEQMYMDALVLAKEADARDTSPRVAGDGAYYRYRLAQMPRGADVS